MQVKELLNKIIDVLEDRKGQNITVLDVMGKTCITDYMVLVTSTSERHAKALSEYVAAMVKDNGIVPIGVEGQHDSDWVLLDLGDVILHIMTAQARDFYQLEKLWTVEYQSEDEELTDYH